VIRLIAAELRRAWSRRLLRVFALVGAGAALVFAPQARIAYGEIPAVVMGISVTGIIGSWLLGASLVGAEWHTGSMTTLLTWEPRRLRVLVVKLLVAALAGAVFAIVLGSLFALLLAAGAHGPREGWIGHTAGALARISAVTALAAVLGGSLATIGRSTAASMGVGFAYIAVIESLIRGYRPSFARYLLVDNIVTWIAGHDPGFGLSRPLTLSGAATVLVSYGVGLALLAWLSFRERDVT
jgi:ABC-2 type transport system permease protein